MNQKTSQPRASLSQLHGFNCPNRQSTKSQIRTDSGMVTTMCWDQVTMLLPLQKHCESYDFKRGSYDLFPFPRIWPFRGVSNKTLSDVVYYTQGVLCQQQHQTVKFRLGYFISCQIPLGLVSYNLLQLQNISLNLIPKWEKKKKKVKKKKTVSPSCGCSELNTALASSTTTPPMLMEVQKGMWPKLLRLPFRWLYCSSLYQILDIFSR